MPKRKRNNRDDRRVDRDAIQKLKKKLKRLEKRLDSSSESSHESDSSDSEALYGSDHRSKDYSLDQYSDVELGVDIPQQGPSALPSASVAQDRETAPLHLLGLSSLENTKEGPIIHEEIARLWQELLAKGIERDERNQLLNKYPIVKNCENLLAPKINGEILVALTASHDEATKKTDNFLSKLQDHLGSGLSALAVPVDKLFSRPSEETNPLLANLLDAGRLLTDMHHTISLHRRYLISPSLNPALKKTVDESKIDSFLYGEDFTDRLKVQQDIQRSSMQLKLVKPSYSNVLIKKNATEHSKNRYGSKNFHRPVQPFKMKNGEGSRAARHQKYKSYQNKNQSGHFRSQHKRRN